MESIWQAYKISQTWKMLFVAKMLWLTWPGVAQLFKSIKLCCLLNSPNSSFSEHGDLWNQMVRVIRMSQINLHIQGFELG